MLKKKYLIFGFLFVLAASWLSAQSLADLSKKEKARRAGTKDKPAAVITNADLAKLKKRPSVEVADPEKAATEAAAAQAAAGEASPAATPEGTAEAAAVQAQAAPEQQKTPEQAAADEQAAQAAMAEKDFKARLVELGDKAQKAREMVELLTLKMNSLWQEFYNMSDVKTREYTQFQISETYDKLTKAEADAAKAEKELNEFMATAKREGVPSIWIK
jgi:hypothetical protein